MDFTDYQKAADRTLRVVPGAESGQLAIMGLGLAGEVGECIEHIKKYLGHGKELDVMRLKIELGDVLWYLSSICTLCDLSLDGVATGNVEKLLQRYPHGFVSGND